VKSIDGVTAAARWERGKPVKPLPIPARDRLAGSRVSQPEDTGAFPEAVDNE
jgi:hypothetical protein